MAAQTQRNTQQITDSNNYGVNEYNSQIPNSNAAKSACAYASMIDIAGEQLDEIVYKSIGKVVCVQATIMRATPLTSIRFSTDEKDPNPWNIQVFEVQRKNPDVATYAVIIPQALMDRQLFFKVGLATSNTWSRTWAIDLKSHGFLTTIRLHPVTFGS